jgi:hypothetical protein
VPSVPGSPETLRIAAVALESHSNPAQVPDRFRWSIGQTHDCKGRLRHPDELDFWAVQ